MRSNLPKLIWRFGAGIALALALLVAAGLAPASAQVRVRVSVPVRINVPQHSLGGVSRSFGTNAATSGRTNRNISVRGGDRGPIAARGRQPTTHIGRVWVPEVGPGDRRYYHRRSTGSASSSPPSATSSSVAGTAGGNAGGGLPAAGERRFVPDEVIVAFSADASPQAIGRLTRRYRLTQLEAQSFPLIGTTLSRLRVGGGRSVPSVLRGLQNQGVVAFAQPNYRFGLQDEAAPAAASTPGDPAQYVLAKLDVAKAQQIATGASVPVAVIDSEIDGKHPDLGGSIAKNFDALAGSDKPQLHGTEMAGAIAAHGKLLGIAPGVKVLAARAFDEHSSGTSFAIYKSLQWAVDSGARIVNMSFAGPADPLLHRLLAAAFAKDIVLIAAAGNAGPKSPPLYPAADANVIAVTATDADDHPFKMANRGDYIAIAAPGVDILALAPDDGYELTTGTSVATAHVSGVVALMLQHDPAVKPAEIRTLLMNTATPLPSSALQRGGEPVLVNAYRAVSPPVASVGAETRGEQAKQ